MALRVFAFCLFARFIDYVCEEKLTASGHSCPVIRVSDHVWPYKPAKSVL